jgi:enolase
MVSPTQNQLLRIEEELGADAVYPGWEAFPRFSPTSR